MLKSKFQNSSYSLFKIYIQNKIKLALQSLLCYLIESLTG
jgi:hypothetical protein